MKMIDFIIAVLSLIILALLLVALSSLVWVW